MHSVSEAGTFCKLFVQVDISKYSEYCDFKIIDIAHAENNHKFMIACHQMVVLNLNVPFLSDAIIQTYLFAGRVIPQIHKYFHSMKITSYPVSFLWSFSDSNASNTWVWNGFSHQGGLTIFHLYYEIYL